MRVLLPNRPSRTWWKLRHQEPEPWQQSFPPSPRQGSEIQRWRLALLSR
jgi:hypothetical protein